MICEVCGRDLPHGVGRDRCLTYGGRVMCYECLIVQPVCTRCNKRRMGAFMVDGVCEECQGENTLRDIRTRLAEAAAIPAPETARAPGFLVNPIEEAPDEVEWETERVLEEDTTPFVTKSGQCPVCKDYYGMLYPAKGDKFICMTCLNNSGVCRKCGKYTILEEYSGYCRECSRERPMAIEHNWRYRPHRFKKWGYSSDKLYFGIENEMECTIPKRDYLKHISGSYYFDEVYTMHDGTIGYGTEVVMHPRTFESIKEFDFKPMLTGIKPDRTTGMHIHLSREAFLSKMHLYKFMRFFAKNKGFIEFIAERKSNLYRAWEFTEQKHVISKAKGYELGEGKYIDVNLRHYETVEVRVFKGATKVEQIMKNVEFCHALWKFSKTHVPKKMTRIQFEKWLETQGDYPNLTAYIERRKS